MTISRITLSRRMIALKTPFITALRRADAVEVIEVCIHTACGYEGVGSTSPSEAITGESSAVICNAIQKELIKALVHLSVEEALDALQRHENSCNSAKAALDMALYDLMARQSGVYLHDFFDNASGKCMVTARTISLKEVDAMVNDAKSAFARGEDILKVKLGAKDGKDSERVHAIAHAVPKATLLLDINQAYTLDETLAFIETVKNVDIALIEQPVPAAELEALKQITLASDIPILADESVFQYEDALKIIEGAYATMINVKLMKCGGVTQAAKILELCRKHGVECMMGSMLEGPVSIYAALCLAYSYRDVCIYIDLDSPLLYNENSIRERFYVSQNRLCFCEENGF